VELAGTPISDRSDALLVRDARAGSTEAFNLLVRRWERKVYGYLVYLTGHPEDACDLSQEVFVAAYQKLGQLRKAETFRQWLFEIAHNRAYSYLRREKRQQTVLSDAEPPEGASGVRLMEGAKWERAESRILVERALAALSAEQREAIVLKFYQGLRFDEIAAIQNCPVSTIKTRFYVGFSQLRKILQP
jgi:RNA polymerase sigma-70 factor, ECF subfamily